MFEEQTRDIDWNNEGGNRSKESKFIARYKQFVSWRDWLVKMEGCPVRWRQEEARAVVVKVAEPDKKCVMKHMAELWLKEEVNNLEMRGGGGGDERCIIIVDCAAMLSDPHMIKRVAGYKKFKMIVPQVVIRELDNIKKQNRNARLSIRWLERELSRGHKGISAQEPDHKLNIHLTPPHRKSSEWSRFNILQCVAYQVEAAVVAANNEQVILLTADQHILHKTDQKAVQLLSEMKVRIEDVSNFMQRFVGLEDKESRSNSRHRGWSRNRPHRSKGGGQHQDSPYYQHKRERAQRERVRHRSGDRGRVGGNG